MASKADILYQKEHIHDNRVPSLVASNVVCFGIACIAVFLRFISRKVAKVKYEADDWFIVAGLIFSAGVLICSLLGTHFGLGEHAILMTNAAGLAQSTISAEVIYNVAMFCIKASILYLYYRIFSISRGFTITLWAVAIFVFCYSVAQTFAAIFQCVPIEAVWNPKVKGRCINTDLAATILAALNVVTDFVILIIPMPLLWHMQMAMKKKLQIMGTFLLGGFVCFASIYRCVIIHTLSLTDPSWSDADTDIWTMVELGMAILCACLPPMRPLLTRTLTKITSNGQESNDRAIMQQCDSSLALEPTRLIPSQSVNFAHLGVLHDLERGSSGQVGIEKF